MNALAPRLCSCRRPINHPGDCLKTCSTCYRDFTREQFLSLPPPMRGARQDTEPGMWLELRQCVCGSTLGIEGHIAAERLRELSPELYTALAQLLDGLALNPGAERVAVLVAKGLEVLRRCRP